MSRLFDNDPYAEDRAWEERRRKHGVWCTEKAARQKRVFAIYGYSTNKND